MIRQIKCICLLFALVFSPLHLAAQEDPGTLHDMQVIDSIRKVLTNDYARQLDRYRQLSEQQSAANRSSIDSLQNLLNEMERETRNLARGSKSMRADLETLQLALEQHEVLFQAEKQKFTSLLLVTGPSLLALILLSTVLFFLLLRRQQESADRKINALKKYTYSEIEETRTDLIKKFRKRVKKLRASMNTGKDGKQGKDRKKKKDKSAKKG